MIRSAALACLLAATALPAHAAPACTSTVSHFREVIDADGRTGNLSPKVYVKADQDLKHAEADCAAGNSQSALNEVRAIKSRYGYP